MAHNLPPPKKGKKPEKIKTKNEPGGPETPGAKKKREKIKDGSDEGHRLTGRNQ